MGLGANLSEIPGSPPPLTLTSGSSRASALSEGPPFLPCDTLEELFFVEPVSAVNLRPSPKFLSNFSAQQGMCQELTEMFCVHTAESCTNCLCHSHDIELTFWYGWRGVWQQIVQRLCKSWLSLQCNLRLVCTQLHWVSRCRQAGMWAAAALLVSGQMPCRTLHASPAAKKQQQRELRPC